MIAISEDLNSIELLSVNPVNNKVTFVSSKENTKKSKVSSCFAKCFDFLIISSCFPITNKTFNKIIVFFVFSIILWLVTFILVGKLALPGGIFFSLAVLLVSCHVFGFLCEKIKLPSLFAMLLVGILFKNVPVLSIVGKSIDSSTSSILRSISFCVILCRAGLSLDLKTIYDLKLKIAKYSFIPCLTETVSFALVAKYVLEIPFLWSFLLGFVISGVSPAVVVPLMIQCQEQGLGTVRKIPSLVVASSCIDNIIAIAGHSLIIGIIFNKGEIWWTVTSCLLQILLGVLYGILIGLFFNIIRVEHTISLIALRFSALILFSLIALLGSKKIAFTSAGPLAVLTLMIIAKNIWDKVDSKLFDLKKIILKEEIQNGIVAIFSKLWSVIFLPTLFSLIGNEVDFKGLDLNTLGLGFACLCVGLVFRILATYFSVTFNSFETNEKLFLCIAWIPKATVQAAVGSMALDLAREANNTEFIKIATSVLNIAVLSIVTTAPLGTILISLSAPKLLSKETKDEI